MRPVLSLLCGSGRHSECDPYAWDCLCGCHLIQGDYPRLRWYEGWDLEVVAVWLGVIALCSVIPGLILWAWLS